LPSIFPCTLSLRSLPRFSQALHNNWKALGSLSCLPRNSNLHHSTCLDF
jgi:hypothetical protein